MTSVTDRPIRAPRPVVAPVRAAQPARPATPADAPDEKPSGGRVAVVVLAWTVVSIATIAIVLYALTPYFAQRDQAQLLEQYRVELQQSANESLTIGGVTTPKTSVEPGTAVGILEIGPLRVQQVAVEGATPSQTAQGPGHVPGTAGLGQPGNAVVVGRRATWGGPFGDLGDLHKGDQILVTTRQGQSVYVVDSVGDHTIDDSPAAVAAANANLYGTADAAPPDPLTNEVVHVDDLYGPTADNRLTLVTSASAIPTNGSSATIVVAKMVAKPYRPTPQGGLLATQTGRTGDVAAWAPLILALLFYGAAIGAAILLYRRSSLRVAYLLTAAPLLVGTILVAESVSRLLPAWM